MFSLELALPPAQAGRFLRHIEPIADRARAWPIQRAWPPDAPAATATFTGRGTPFRLRDPALDLIMLRGTLRADDRAQPLCRVTLSGAEALVRDQALAWAASFALAPPHATLGEAADTLAADKPAWEGASRHVVLAPDQTAADGFARLAAHLGATMLACVAAIGRGGEDPGPVHQMRVALRRLRSAFSIFRPLIDCPATTEIAQGLRDLGQALGPARDWDVFLAGTGAQVAAAFPGDPAVAALLHTAAVRRRAAYQALAAIRAGAEFRRLMIQLALLAQGTHWRDTLSAEQASGLDSPLPAFAARVLQKRHRRLLRAGKGFKHLDTPSLHRLRVHGKRLRYATEFFSDLHDTHAADRFITRLSRLQETLGRLNDAVVAAELTTQLGPQQGARGFAIGAVLGFVAAESAHARDHATRPWRRFRKLDPFWA